MKKERLMDGVGGRGIAGCTVAPGKGKAVGLEEERDAGMDELLAAVGYKVRFSDMADVAQKLEQLDMAIGCSSAAQDDALLTHLASDTVHYNPSDLSAWLESMLSELTAPPPARPTNPGSDLRMENGSRNRKRMRSASSSSSSFRPQQLPQSASEAASAEPSVMLLDAQEIGIRLVHALLACAEALQQENLKAADLLVKQISILASSQGGAMRKVAKYFAEALARKIYGFQLQQDSALSALLQMHFYESCPYLKFAHFTANQAILEAFVGFRRVHVVDFGLMQGMQWPALMQALSLRQGGPPSFRLTGISPRHSAADEQVGWKLAQFADAINVGFEYRGYVAGSLADVETFMLETAEAEALAVNSVFELHPLLARPGALEKLLAVVRAARPRIVTIVEQEANHNATGSFVGRFTEALHYYSTMFDSMEGGGGEGQQDRVMSEIYLGRQICNVVACEGPERTERHETLARWRMRMAGAGFEAVLLGSKAFKQASMLLALFAGGDGYRVEETEGCLTLGWHTRPLIAASAWRVADSR